MLMRGEVKISLSEDLVVFKECRRLMISFFLFIVEVI